MHVATRKLLQQHFFIDDYKELEPLIKYHFTHDSSGLTDVYFAKLIRVGRTNMYQKKKRFFEMLKAGKDYYYALSDTNKQIIQFTYDAFIRCIVESYQPATSTENRRRILMVFKLHNIMTGVLEAHQKHLEQLIQRSRATMLRLKQEIVTLEDENKKRKRINDKLDKELEDLQNRHHKLNQNVRGLLGRRLRDLLQTMGFAIDESRKKDIQKWFSLMSFRGQGVAHYDIQTLTKETKSFFLVYDDKVDDLRGDIERMAAKLPLKLCCVENKNDEEKAGCVHSEKRS